jgi:hypothetical protein
MSMSALTKCLFGLILIVCVPVKSALAAQISSWVSVAVGNDSNNCSIAAPCKTLGRALTQTTAGGTISVRDPGDYQDAIITQSVTIVNDSGGTVTTCCGINDVSGLASSIAVLAGANDVVTLRGLTFTNAGVSQMVGVQIFNAHQVNIDNCAFLATTGAAVLVTPNTELQSITLAPNLNVSVEDSIINNSSVGIKITSVPGVHVTATVDRTRINNNAGGGIRADGTGGGAVTVAVSDSTITLNAGNGVLALSGPGTAVSIITRSVIESNALYGVQSNQTNGGTATVTVNGSSITNNVSGQVGSIGGGTILTTGNNLLSGPVGTGFTGPIGLQ